jgi:MFS transporter, DHA1 family, multidrug resistance protein
MAELYNFLLGLSNEGAFSMWFIALDWSDKIRMIGILGAGSGGLVLGLWLMLQKLATPKR